MNKFCPDIHWLTEYAAGNLPLSHSICIAAHLNFNSNSRAIVEKLDCVGSLFFQMNLFQIYQILNFLSHSEKRL